MWCCLSAIKLHINVDHVATIRQARGGQSPDPVWAASLVELAGVDGITVHLREDRRHIQDRDVELLRRTVRGTLNLEMAATEEMRDIALRIHPDVVSLVPEKRQERTTEGGLDAASAGAESLLARVIADLTKAGILVSLFIDPESAQVAAAHRLGATRVELHTGDYCAAFETPSERASSHSSEAVGKTAHELVRLRTAAAEGVRLGLHVAAGHGLDIANVGAVAAIADITELNIGHSVVAHAVLVGLDRAVRELAAAIAVGRRA